MFKVVLLLGIIELGRKERVLQNKFHNYDCFRMVHLVAMEMLPEERDRKYYQERYTCCPPPFFIICVTLLEV